MPSRSILFQLDILTTNNYLSVQGKFIMRYFVLLFLFVCTTAFASDDDIAGYESSDPCLAGYVTTEHLAKLPSVARWIAQKRDSGRSLVSVSRTIVSDDKCVIVPHGLLRAVVLGLTIEIFEGDFKEMTGDEIRQYLKEVYDDVE